MPASTEVLHQHDVHPTLTFLRVEQGVELVGAHTITTIKKTELI
jgi:hypothetical protein